MGYRIEYGENTDHYREKPKNSRIVPMTVAFLILFFILTFNIWTEGRATLEKLLIPGDPQVTKQAFSQMAQDLKEGEAIGDAVITFCKELTNGAALSDP